MIQVTKYSFYDLVRSRWIYFYTGFYFLLGIAVFFLGSDVPKAIVTLMNIIIVLVPLVATLFGSMYYYNSRDFIEMLLTLPIPRKMIFLGLYTGVAGSLCISFLLGLGIPFILFGLFASKAIWDFSILLIAGMALTFIFCGLSMWIALANENRLMGFGVSLLIWLFFAVIYDGLILITMSTFSEYPLENFALISAVLNPIDLNRILILLKMDISALMGMSGAVFKKFLGTTLGGFTAFAVSLVWIVVPIIGILRIAGKKDF